MNDTVTIGETTIPYRTRTSARAKRLRLVVKPDETGTVIVELVTPHGTRPARVAAFIEAKRRWIFNAVREVEARQGRQLQQQYRAGARLQYRGRWLSLNVRRAEVPTVRIRCRSRFDVEVPADLPLTQHDPQIEAAFHRWLKGRALRDLERLGPEYGAALGVEASAFRLSDARRRWGSCSVKGAISVHWRLAQAPMQAFEYVVAHEMAHLVHRHHQPAFWATLAAVMPDWAARRAVLEGWETAPRAV